MQRGAGRWGILGNSIMGSTGRRRKKEGEEGSYQLLARTLQSSYLVHDVVPYSLLNLAGTPGEFRSCMYKTVVTAESESVSKTVVAFKRTL